jgi:hypothetical protein
VATSLNLFEPPDPPPGTDRPDPPPRAAKPAEARPPEAKPAEPGPVEARSAARASAVAQPEAPPLDRFAVLLGRAPTDAEKLELVRVKEALDLDNNDALWLLIMGLDHLRGRFERSVEGQRRAFEQSVDRRLEETRHAADALIESAKTQFLRDFPAALKAAARKVSIRARGFDGPVVLGGLIAGLALLLAGLGGAGWLAYALGERAGFERGVLTARAETAPKPPAPPAKGR